MDAFLLFQLLNIAEAIQLNEFYFYFYEQKFVNVLFTMVLLNTPVLQIRQTNFSKLKYIATQKRHLEATGKDYVSAG